MEEPTTPPTLGTTTAYFGTTTTTTVGIPTTPTPTAAITTPTTPPTPGTTTYYYCTTTTTTTVAVPTTPMPAQAATTPAVGTKRKEHPPAITDIAMECDASLTNFVNKHPRTDYHSKLDTALANLWYYVTEPGEGSFKSKNVDYEGGPDVYFIQEYREGATMAINLYAPFLISRKCFKFW